jgi:hypothetical protein
METNQDLCAESDSPKAVSMPASTRAAAAEKCSYSKCARYKGERRCSVPLVFQVNANGEGLEIRRYTGFDPVRCKRSVKHSASDGEMAPRDYHRCAYKDSFLRTPFRDNYVSQQKPGQKWIAASE